MYQQAGVSHICRVKFRTDKNELGSGDRGERVLRVPTSNDSASETCALHKACNNYIYKFGELLICLQHSREGA